MCQKCGCSPCGACGAEIVEGVCSGCDMPADECACNLEEEEEEEPLARASEILTGDLPL